MLSSPYSYSISYLCLWSPPALQALTFPEMDGDMEAILALTSITFVVAVGCAVVQGWDTILSITISSRQI